MTWYTVRNFHLILSQKIVSLLFLRVTSIQHLISIEHHSFLDNTGYTQKNCEVSKFMKKSISVPARARHTLLAAETAQVSHAIPAVRFSCLLRGRGTSCQDGVAA
jgi:hypothetical protein